MKQKTKVNVQAMPYDKCMAELTGIIQYKVIEYMYMHKDEKLSVQDILSLLHLPEHRKKAMRERLRRNVRFFVMEDVEGETYKQWSLNKETRAGIDCYGLKEYLMCFIKVSTK